MDSGMWAAIVGSVILVCCGGVGWLATSHLSSTKEDAEAAHNKAHALEVLVLEQRALHSEEMRKSQVAMLEYQLYVANTYVKKDDHSEIITEIFRKLDNQDRQMSSNFSDIRKW